MRVVGYLKRNGRTVLKFCQIVLVALLTTVQGEGTVSRHRA